MGRFATALFMAVLCVLHGAWALRPAATGNAEADRRSDLHAPLHGEFMQQMRVQLVNADGSAGLHWAVGLGLFVLVPVGGLLLTCCILGIPWEDRSSCGICIKFSFAAAAALGIYTLLFLVPFALQSSDEVLLTANVSIPQASLIKDSAVTDMLEKHNVTTPMTFSLFDPDGHFIMRHKEGDGSWLDYHMDFTWSTAMFNWIKAHRWDASRQCEPISFACTTLTMAAMPFTHRAALPGAVILRDAGVVKGVFTVAGGSDDQNQEVAAGAAKSAGYRETVSESTNDFDLNPDEDAQPQESHNFFR